MKYWKIKTAVCTAAAAMVMSMSVCAENQVQILTKTQEASEESFARITKYPRVILDENPVAAERIMQSYQAVYLTPRESRIEQFIEEEKIYFPEDYNPELYTFGDEIRCGRADEKIISLRAEYWRNTGGPHPNSEYRGAVFSSESGQLLALSDLLIGDGKSGQKLVQMIETKLGEQYGDHLYASRSVTEYAALAVAEQDSWYLTETGLVFFFDPDEIAPYAAGLIEVEIPYEELGEMMQVQYLETREQYPAEEYSWAESCMILWNDVVNHIVQCLE